MFHVGQKVVCVDASVTYSWAPGAEIIEGAVYTVRGLGLDVTGQPGLRLHEVELTGPFGHVSNGPYKDKCYRATRFRPVIERKTNTGFAVLEEIRNRESVPVEPRKPARITTAHGGGDAG
jgi:hypothetical protein